jgi:hypothetical protein
LLTGAVIWDFAPETNGVKSNQQGQDDCQSGGNQDCLKDGLDLHLPMVSPPRWMKKLGE